ncbi:hypothetical protein PQR71_28420 [Paraburkholderia fungorum]|uniref:hypothetical protein n=1 Tax=Paraburkholderia fungorum TaxID=134537 RepID=UPI0038BCBA94
MKTNSKLVASRLDHHITAHGAALAYRRLLVRQRALFAAPSADLLTLVIAEAVKRKAQTEIQRDALRDAMFEMPVAPERGQDRGVDIYPADPDDYT